MKELVEVIAKALVDNPDEVVVTESQKGEDTLIELKVASADMGKVIGKQGRIAKAIRSVVKAAASKEDKKVIVEIQYSREKTAGPWLAVFVTGDCLWKKCSESASSPPPTGCAAR